MARPTVVQTVLSSRGLFRDITLPAKRILCPVCEGAGSHVDPAVDGHGLTAEDLQDEEFREDYLAGVYDVPCEACIGEKVVLIPDETHLGKRIIKGIRRFEREQIQWRNDDYYERRAGA